MTRTERQACAEQHAREYAAGETCAQIAAREGLSTHTVYYRLQKLATVMRPPGFPKGRSHPNHLRKVAVQDYPAIVAMRKNGTPLKAIGKRFNVTFQSIQQILRRAA